MKQSFTFFHNLGGVMLGFYSFDYLLKQSRKIKEKKFI